MAGRGLRVAVIVLGMLAMVQQTMQLKITNPTPILEIPDPSQFVGPYFGLILASDTNELALNNSKLWKPTAYVDIAGRRFRAGLLDLVPVVAVVSGSLSAQASVTTQIMLSYFRIRGIVHVGSALTIDSSLPIGSVSVVKSAAFTGLWTWKPLRERLGAAVSQLRFGDYGFPNPGLNYLGTISYDKVKVFNPEYTPTPETAFWHEIDAVYYQDSASRLKVDLKQCYNSSHCLSKKPELVFGVKASTSDIYLENPFYAKFLHENFKVSSVDTQTATVILTAKANGVPVIVFRAASNSLDTVYDSAFSYLASENAVAAAAGFVRLYPTPRANVQSY